MRREAANQCAAETGQGIIRDLLREGSMDQEEIVRVIVDLFIAAADTVSEPLRLFLHQS